MKTKFYADLMIARCVLANKIATEKLGRQWSVQQTESGWYFVAIKPKV
jgi:hypothetical protein